MFLDICSFFLEYTQDIPYLHTLDLAPKEFLIFVLSYSSRKSSTSSIEPSPKPSPKTSAAKSPTAGTSRIRRKAEESGLRLKIGSETTNFGSKGSANNGPESGPMTPKVKT